MRQRKTDYGTIILHWLLVAAFSVSFVSGLRIATEAPGRSWINLFDAVLPRQSVWVAHMQAAVVLVAVSLAYAVYVAKSGLGRRVQLDKIRLRGLFGRKQARLGAYNIVLYWIFFVTMLGLIASGGLLYFGFYAGHDVATLHWYGTWVIMAFAGLHVLSHYRLGGVSQLLRIFRPTGLTAPPPRLDAVELLTLLAEQSARLAPESAQPPVTPAPPPHDGAQDRTAARSSAAHAAGSQATSQPQNRATRRFNPTLLSSPQPSPSPALRSSWRRTGWRSTSCRFIASAARTYPSSTAIPPIGPGATSRRFR